MGQEEFVLPLPIFPILPFLLSSHLRNTIGTPLAPSLYSRLPCSSRLPALACRVSSCLVRSVILFLLLASSPIARFLLPSLPQPVAPTWRSPPPPPHSSPTFFFYSLPSFLLARGRPGVGFCACIVHYMERCIVLRVFFPSFPFFHPFVALPSEPRVSSRPLGSPRTRISGRGGGRCWARSAPMSLLFPSLSHQGLPPPPPPRTNRRGERRTNSKNKTKGRGPTPPRSPAWGRPAQWPNRPPLRTMAASTPVQHPHRASPAWDIAARPLRRRSAASLTSTSFPPVTHPVADRETGRCPLCPTAPSVSVTRRTYPTSSQPPSLPRSSTSPHRRVSQLSSS